MAESNTSTNIYGAAHAEIGREMRITVLKHDADFHNWRQKSGSKPKYFFLYLDTVICDNKENGINTYLYELI